MRSVLPDMGKRLHLTSFRHHRDLFNEFAAAVVLVWIARVFEVIVIRDEQSIGLAWTDGMRQQTIPKWVTRPFGGLVILQPGDPFDFADAYNQAIDCLIQWMSALGIEKYERLSCDDAVKEQL